MRWINPCFLSLSIVLPVLYFYWISADNDRWPIDLGISSKFFLADIMQRLLLCASRSKTVQDRVNCRGHLCKHGGSEHIVPFSPAAYRQNIHLSAPSFCGTIMAADCIIQEQFQPNFMGCLDTAASDPNLQTWCLQEQKISFMASSLPVKCAPRVGFCCWNPITPVL